MQLCSFSMYCTVRKAFSWLTSNQEYLGQLDSNWILAPSSCPDTLYWYDSLWNWEKIGGKGLKPSWWWWCTIKFTVFVLGPSRLWTYFSKPWDCFNSLLSLMHCVHIDLTMLLLLLVLCVQITNVYWTHVFWSSWTCEPWLVMIMIWLVLWFLNPHWNWQWVGLPLVSCCIPGTSVYGMTCPVSNLSHTPGPSCPQIMFLLENLVMPKLS